MNKQDEVVYLGRVISLLARHSSLTLGEIKNKTRHFIRRHRQNDSNIFQLLEQFVAEGYLKRVVKRSRVLYSLSDVASPSPKAPKVSKLDLLETASSNEDEIIKRLAEHAKSYKERQIKDSSYGSLKNYTPAPPPSGEGDPFK